MIFKNVKMLKMMNIIKKRLAIVLQAKKTL